MPAFEEKLSLEEIDAQIAKFREMRRAVKKTGKVAERKIGTLERRRQRLVNQLAAIDAQIAALQREASLLPDTPAPRRRGRKPKSALTTA